MRGRCFILTVVLVAALTACATIKFSGAEVTEQLPAYTWVGTFDVTVWVNEFLGSSGGTALFNITAEAMGDL